MWQPKKVVSKSARLERMTDFNETDFEEIQLRLFIGKNKWSFEWECECCTFKNTSYWDICEICEQLRKFPTQQKPKPKYERRSIVKKIKKTSSEVSK